MRNHIAFKFLAIFLCAAALLGIIGSSAGLYVMTEGDLYSRSVDSLYEERLQNYGSDLADYAAWRYAAKQLGSCPDGLLNTLGTYYNNSHVFRSGSYGYTITDAEGNVLEDFTTPALTASAAHTFTFSAGGKYPYLVDSMTGDAHRNPELTYDPTTFSGNFESYDNIAHEGSTVAGVEIVLANGLAYDLFNAEGLGFVIHNQNGNVVFRFFHANAADISCPANVVRIILYEANGSLIYEATSSNGTGTFFFSENGNLVYESYAQVDAEPASEIAEAAEPMIVAETLPEETDPTVIDEVEAAIALYETFYREHAARAEEYANDRFYQLFYKQFDEDSAVYFYSVYDDYFGEHLEEFEQDDFYWYFSKYFTENSSVFRGVTFPAATEAAPASTEETTETVPAQESSEETAEATEATVAEETSETEAAVTEETTPTVSTEPAAAVAATEPAVILEETVIETEPPVQVDGKALDEYDLNNTYYHDHETGEEMYAEYIYVNMPELTVTLYLAEHALQDSTYYDILLLVQQYHDWLFPMLGVSLLLLAVSVVYLCCAAGRKPNSTEVRAEGLNALPLDLHLGLSGFLAMVAFAAGLALFQEAMSHSILVSFAAVILCVFLACLLCVSFFFALAAQLKTGSGHWWRNTVIARCCKLCMRFGLWLEEFLGQKGFPWLGRMTKALWKFTRTTLIWLYRTTESAILWTGRKLGRIFRWSGKKFHRFLSLLPITWQWLVVGLIIILFSLLMHSRSTVLILLGMLVPIATILYVAHCFGLLAESTKRMSKGDLDTKVDDKLMLGCFQEFAGDLNALADVAVVAAQKQLKSERMKTELITNVSHDIKTPLTSIINYVDLLQKPHSEEEEAQYLEVLDRQSLRLKKLIDDLMDMSKASTGNMTVDITRVDAVESVNQALGEFADKLDRVELIPVFRHAEQSVPMLADGRLVWRVMSNLLSNAVKYAMPGTRLYIDLMTMEGKVILSMKNISREELNVDAEELMERFVRGDDSRNTEGSGLGLNIAKSLMELQKGQLQLLVDGDLFKVTLIFPGV